MNKEVVMIDFSLPNNPNTLKFIKLNQSDKLKAIALGMRFLSTGTQQLQMWDNSQWETRIEQIKTQKQDGITLSLAFSASFTTSLSTHDICLLGLKA